MKHLFKRLEPNKYGRDFIIGDLHGCLDLLYDKMKEVDFDKSKDRLFCTGDLIDRGPNSFECLKLIEQPWFHSVLGNHEDMLLSWYNKHISDYHLPYDFIRNGGDWVRRLDKDNAEYLEKVLIPKLLNEIPLVIEVIGKYKFFIAHSQRSVRDVKTHKNVLLNDRKIRNVERLNNVRSSINWGRNLIKEVITNEYDTIISQIDDNSIEVIKSNNLFNKGVTLTYVGHNKIKKSLLSNSHVFIDTGAYEAPVGKLTMINNKEFQKSLF